MKNLIVLILLMLTACSTGTTKQPNSPTAAAQPAAAENQASVVNNGLSDLDAVTFACPKAALNAASREVKKAATMGSYQFSYFRIVNNSHHAQYEIHFTSNVHEEPELIYCVSIYCQQGWDPKTSKTTVELMNDSGRPNSDHKTSADMQNCGHEPPPRAHQRKKK